MSQSPESARDYSSDGGYAEAARQLNKLVRSGKSYSGHERNCCYLNLGGQGYANVSRLSGFDFPEDGRAVVATDWDGDGDLDLWVANRTAPQLRWMQNRIADQSSHAYVAFQLKGTTSNRDAVGARVRLLDEKQSTTLVRTVRAGEGFLAGNSKQLHFGLGSARPQEVRVRWPSGNDETFSLPAVNQTYLLEEGTGRSVAIHRKKASPLLPAEPPIPQHSFAASNWLTEPAISPPLQYLDAEQNLKDATTSTGSPRIVSLWASWCQPCLDELTEWAEQSARFEQHAVEVLLVCTDGVSETPRSESEAVLTRLSLPAELGDATPQFLDCLQHFQNVIYDHHRPLPMPTTLLLDAKGRVRGFYKGRVSVDRLLVDVDRLRREDSELPFSGEWLGAQATHNLSLMVEELYRDGLEEQATLLVERMQDKRMHAEQIEARLYLARMQSKTRKAESLRQLLAVLDVQPQNVAAHEQLGLLMARAGRQREALHHFEQAVVNSSQPEARTRFNYARSLRLSGHREPAIEQLEFIVNQDPEFVSAWEQLGLLRANSRDFQRAVECFTRAVELDTSEVRHVVNLGMALNQLSRHEEAWECLQPVAAAASAPKAALLASARALMGLGRNNDAASLLEKFLEKEPNAEGIRAEMERLRALPPAASETPAKTER